MSDFLPAAALAALVLKITDFFKAVTNKDVNTAVSQLVVWAGGVIAVFIYAQTQWADSIVFAGRTLSQMNAGSLIAIGLGVGSTASFAFDTKKALDQSDSAKQPPLLPPPSPPPPAAASVEARLAALEHKDAA